MIIASLPHILGADVRNTMCLAVLSATGDPRLRAVGAADSLSTERLTEVAAGAAAFALAAGDAVVVPLLIGNGQGSTSIGARQRWALDTVLREIRRFSATTRNAAWADSTAHGAPWGYHDRPAMVLRVPPADTSAIGAIGHDHAFPTFENIVHCLDGTSDALQDDVHQYLLAAVNFLVHNGKALTERRRQARTTALTAIDKIAEGGWTEDPAVLVDTAIAVTQEHVVHSLIDHCVADDNDVAYELFRSLVAAVRAHIRAEPAVLLAACAYARGEILTASAALTIAMAANPSVILAAEIAVLLNMNVSPATFVAIMRNYSAKLNRAAPTIAE